MNSLRNHQGQALVEVPLFFVMFTILLASVVGVTQWMIVRQKLVMAAKEGALLYSSGHLKPFEVESRVKRFLVSGTPALNAQALTISVGRDPSLLSRIYELDQVRVRYTRPKGWYRLLGLDSTMEEKCIVQHAPHYELPLQTLWGPSVPW